MPVFSHFCHQRKAHSSPFFSHGRARSLMVFSPVILFTLKCRQSNSTSTSVDFMCTLSTSGARPRPLRRPEVFYFHPIGTAFNALSFLLFTIFVEGKSGTC